MRSLKTRLRDAKRSFSSWLKGHPHIETVFSAFSVLVLIPTIGFLYVVWGVLVCIKWVYEQFKRGVRKWHERHLLKPEEIARRKGMRRLRDGVRDLPERRKRRLTLGERRADMEDKLETEQEPHAEPTAEEQRKHSKKTRRRYPGGVSGSVEQITIDQLGKSVFWRLPFEVREEIWKYAVGYHHIHIVHRRGRLGNVYCPADDPTDPLRRDLCLETRDEQGFYRPTAWPRDMRPLSLLLSCRQIYSESIDFLYLLNTFAFDEAFTLQVFLSRLIPHRKTLVSHIRISPNFGSDLYRSHNPGLTQTYAPSNREPTVWTLPKLRSLSITPRLDRRLPSPNATRGLIDRIQFFLSDLATAQCATPQTLWWPETDPDAEQDYTWWARDEYLPAARNYVLRRIPKRYPTVLVAFLFPVHVLCLHCAEPTVIRKTTRGSAEATYFSDASGILRPDRKDPTLARYCTFHTHCGGWIELEFDLQAGGWSVTQGGRQVGDEEAKRHEEEHPERYVPVPSAHMLLQGLVKSKGFPAAVANGGTLDPPTCDAFYRNAGWVAEGPQGGVRVEERDSWGCRVV